MSQYPLNLICIVDTETQYEMLQEILVEVHGFQFDVHCLLAHGVQLELPSGDAFVVVSANPMALLRLIAPTEKKHIVFVISDSTPDTDVQFTEWLSLAVLEAAPSKSLLKYALEAHLNRFHLDEVSLISKTQSALARAMNFMIEPQQAANHILTIISDLVRYDAANIGLFDNQDMKIRFHRKYPEKTMDQIEQLRFSIDTPNLRDIVRGGRIHYLFDISEYKDWKVIPPYDWVKSWIGVPIRRSGHVVGILNLDFSKPNAFTMRHIQRLEAVSDQISAVMEAVQLYETLDDYTNLLAVLSRQNSFLFAPLSTYTDLDEMCQRIAETVVNMFGKTDCGVMLLNSETGELERYARVGEFDVKARHKLFLYGEGLASQAARTGNVVYAPDVTQSENYVTQEPRTRSELVIPLKTHQGVIGVIDLQSTRLDAFTKRDREGLMAFAEHAALAIHNLQLFEKERKHGEVLQHRVNEHTAELRRSKERVEAILDRTGAAVLLLDPDGRIQQSNSAFNSMFDVLPDELYNVELVKLMEPKDHEHVRQIMHQVQREGEKQTVEGRMRSSDQKSWVSAELIISPIRSHDYLLPEMVCSIRDVTKHKVMLSNLEELLERERELSALKTNFILTVSHEFRTPLAIILSSSEILRQYLDRLPEEKRRQHFEKIEKQVRHLETMLDDVLYFGRQQSGNVQFRLEPVDLKTLCERVVANMNQTDASQDVHFMFEGDEDTLITGDEVMLEQILNNLITNAVKYSPNADRVDLRLKVEPEQMTLEVEDYGLGIPEDDLQHLFEPFFRASNTKTIRGNGLGLSIVYHAVEQHHGNIEFQSEVDKGTLVRVVLPRT